MKILIVAATNDEIQLLKDVNLLNHKIDFLVTGPGMVSTTYELTKHLTKNTCELAINCGIAGSFDKSISIGEVVSVKEDTFSEPGAEDGDAFLTLSELGLVGKVKFKNKFQLQPLSAMQLKEVRGITVNTVHGDDKSIQTIITRLKPQIESMEGAAFFYVCEKENIPSLQIRSISNYIERRNKANWNIPLALENLKATLGKLITSL